MFKTSEKSVCDGFPDTVHGLMLWTHVHYPLQKPWLHVEYKTETCSDRRSGEVVIFIREPEQLVDLTKAEENKVIRVLLASPGYLNRTGKWQFEELRDVWKVKTSEGLSYFSFNLQDGRIYDDRPETLKEEIERCKIFSVKDSFL